MRRFLSRLPYFSRFALLLILICSSGCKEKFKEFFAKCKVKVVMSKFNCTFHRELMSRVCVVKLGTLEEAKIGKLTKGRSSATKLQEPLEVGETKVHECQEGSRKVYKKIL